MEQVDLATILVSAGVALVVTLGLEWAAKPRLEARKERILEGRRNRREIERALRVAHVYIGSVASLQRTPLPSDPDDLQSLSAESRRLVQQASAEADELMRRIGLITDAGPDLLLFELLTATTGTIKGIVMSGRPLTDDRLAKLDEFMTHSLLVLSHASWSPLGQRARKGARAWLDEEAKEWTPAPDHDPRVA